MKSIFWPSASLTTGSQSQRRVGAFTCDDLTTAAGGANHLRAFSWLQFNTVNQRTNGDISQRQRITNLDGRLAARHNLVAGPDTLGGQNVTTFAIRIQHQSKMRAAIGVVFDPLNLPDNAVLVTLEIDSPIAALVTATAMPRRNPAHIVSAATAGDLLDQRLMWLAFMQLRRIDPDGKPSARRGRSKFL